MERVKEFLHACAEADPELPFKPAKKARGQLKASLETLTADAYYRHMFEIVAFLERMRDRRLAQIAAFNAMVEREALADIDLSPTFEPELHSMAA